MYRHHQILPQMHMTQRIKAHLSTVARSFRPRTSTVRIETMDLKAVHLAELPAEWLDDGLRDAYAGAESAHRPGMVKLAC